MLSGYGENHAGLSRSALTCRFSRFAASLDKLAAQSCRYTPMDRRVGIELMTELQHFRKIGGSLAILKFGRGNTGGNAIPVLLCSDERPVAAKKNR